MNEIILFGCFILMVICSVLIAINILCSFVVFRKIIDLNNLITSLISVNSKILQMNKDFLTMPINTENEE